MKILFTGGSSFTGHWFVRALARAGADVVATFTRGAREYEGLRAERVAGLGSVCDRVFDCAFGTDAFMELIRSESAWDLLCHHGADVTDYKSPSFDVFAALGNNCRNVAGVLEAFGERGGSRVLITGSVFEPDEGAGDARREAFSPYGLSKGLTAQVFRYHAHARGLGLGKFVIPNPFGPMEEPRFTTYLARTWLEGRTAAVNTPDYVRDNIHVSLLAATYARFALPDDDAPSPTTAHPSGYVERQGAFAERFARELRGRLGVPCELELSPQTDFSEPLERFNVEPAVERVPEWNEAAAWDELAASYLARFGPGAPADDPR